MSVTRLDPASFDWASGSGGAAEVRRIWEAASSADRRSPLDEAALLALRHHGLATGVILAVPSEGNRLGGFAYVRGLSGPGRPELDLVVDPAVRGRGIGGELGRAVVELTDGIPITAWSHGDHPAARALAKTLEFSAVRELWLMRRTSSAPLPDAPAPAGVTIRSFRPGTSDEAEFLAVNAAAFASHPEQGSLDQAGLTERMQEPWFDADGFLVAERDGRVDGTPHRRLVGFHWTKVHPAVGDAPAFGEVYVIGIDPSAQAGGLGRALLAAGLRRLHEGPRDGAQGERLDEVVLYVEAENATAIRLYESFGFTHDARDTDVMYARS